MLTKRAFNEESRRLGSLLAAGVLTGTLTGHFTLWLGLVPPAYLAWLLSDLVRTRRWVLQGRPATAPPRVQGLCADIVTRGLEWHRILEEERIRARGEVRQLQRTLHALPDSIVALDVAGRIGWCNDTAESLLGIRMETDAGQPIDNLIRHPDFVAWRHCVPPREPLAIPAPADPNHTLSLRWISYGEGEAVLIARDETEALALQRMREDFISNVSHELKTPLTVLNGYLEGLNEASNTFPRQWRRPLAVMAAQVHRMRRLVEDLLVLSRIESLVRSPEDEVIDVASLLAQLVEEGQVLSGDRAHEIELRCETDLVLAGTERDIRAAFSNLIANAIQYTPPEGRIRIEWRSTPNAAFFEVKDSGEGIEPEHLPRLTERFYRVDPGRSREAGGTGLGLAIVKHVLQHYGARLEITSTPGQGSCFRCRFPRGSHIRKCTETRALDEADRIDSGVLTRAG